MGQKVTFDAINKIIQVDILPVNNIINIDVKEDLYSDMKEDWIIYDLLNKFEAPIRSTGGDPLPGSKALGATFFLDSAWSIRPYESEHRMVVNGNLYKEDGTSPYIPTTGVYNVLIESVVSSLVDSTVQQLSEIENISFANGVTVDVVNGQAGTAYPTGNTEYPSNNIQDTVAIAQSRGFDKIYIRGNLDLIAGDDVSGFTLEGQSPSKTILNIAAESITLACEVSECFVTGTMDGNSEFRTCVIQDVHYVNGYMYLCMINPGTITLGGGSTFYALDCKSGVPGTGSPIIDMGGSGQAMAIRGYDGGIKITNKTGPEAVSIDLASGQVKLDPATVTAGSIVVRGDGKLINADTGEYIYTGTWNGVEILNEANSPLATAFAVLEEDLIDHQIEGTLGGEINHIKHLDYKVFIDTELLVNGVGSQHNPFNNITDGIDYAEAHGINSLVLYSDTVLDRSIKNFTVYGLGTPLVETAGFNLKGTTFSHVELSGIYLERITAQDCLLSGTTTLNGFFENCALSSDFNIPDGATAFIKDCSTLVVGQIPPSIDIGGLTGTANLVMTGYNGGINLINCNQATDNMKIILSVGKIILDSSCTNGIVSLGGIAEVVNTSTITNLNDSTLKPSEMGDIWDASYNKRSRDTGTNIVTLTERDNITTKQEWQSDENYNTMDPI